METTETRTGQPTQVAKFVIGLRIFRLYSDGQFKYGKARGSVIGARATVDQSGSKRLIRDTRQAYLTIEGPDVAICHRLSTGPLAVGSARQFAAKVNQLSQLG